MGIIQSGGLSEPYGECEFVGLSFDSLVALPSLIALKFRSSIPNLAALCLSLDVNVHRYLLIAEIGESVLILRGHQGRIARAVWGPLNKTIVSAGEDAIIRVWDSEVYNSFSVTVIYMHIWL